MDNVTPSFSVNNPLAKALSLAQRGFHVFPCHDDKRPATKHGFHDASDDPLKIKMMFHGAPKATLVGIACPQSQIHVLDIDPKGETYFAANQSQVPETLEIRTRRGGKHLIYSANETLALKNNARNGIDVRSGTPGHGGYIIAWGDAYQYDRRKMSSDFPTGFVQNAWTQAASNGVNPALSSPFGLGINSLGIAGTTIADRIRELVSTASRVPDGDCDNFLIQAYGHVAKAYKDGVIGLEEALKTCGRINNRLVTNLDKDFAGKVIRVGLTADSALAGQYEGYDDGEPIAPFPVNPVAKAQAIFPPVVDPTVKAPTTPLVFTPVSGVHASTAPLKMPRRIIDGMERGELSSLVAQSAAGKSALALLEAAAIVWNRPDLIGDRNPVERAGSVLIVSNEDPLDATEKRLQALCQLHGLNRWTGHERRTLYIVKSQLGVTLIGKQGGTVAALPHLLEIEAWIKAKRADGEEVCALYVDTQSSSIVGLDENAAQDMAPAMSMIANWTDRLNIGTRLVHHQTKAAGENSGTNMTVARGSGAIIAGPRRILNLNVMDADVDLSARWVELVGAKGSNDEPDLWKARYFKRENVKIPLLNDETGQTVDRGYLVLRWFPALPGVVGAMSAEQRAVELVREAAASGDHLRVNSQGGKANSSLKSRMKVEGISAKDADVAIRRAMQRGHIKIERSPIANQNGTKPEVYIPVDIFDEVDHPNDHPKRVVPNPF